MRQLVSFSVPLVVGCLLGYGPNGSIYAKHPNINSILRNQEHCVTLLATHLGAWFVSCCFGSFITSIPLIGLGEFVGYKFYQRDRTWSDAARDNIQKGFNTAVDAAHGKVKPVDKALDTLGKFFS